ncbi:hypothetical protein DL770_000164 [Monosporascus sp. CRB-9-2]|nr:hypothetical protein DL770_000164 [Monosporascus sp. CRB-9-2]
MAPAPPAQEPPANRATSAEVDRFKWLLRQYVDDEERSEEELALAVALVKYTSTKDKKRLVDQLVAEGHPQADVMRLIVDSAGPDDSEEEEKRAARAEEDEEEIEEEEEQEEEQEEEEGEQQNVWPVISFFAGIFMFFFFGQESEGLEAYGEANRWAHI